MKKIENKLKECCLACEHFDPYVCVEIASSVVYCGDPDRVIACGHMDVCAKYNNPGEKEDDFGWTKRELPPAFGLTHGFAYECKKCHEVSAIISTFCPHCGQKNIR